MEKVIENFLFASRWIMAPFYIGLVVVLGILLFSFMQELWHFITSMPNIEQNDVVLGDLSLIDLALAGNLLLIVIFSGYGNFVSKMNFEEHEDHQEWHGSIDFSGLKLKLIASIVAISGIHLLKVFMDVDKTSDRSIKWMVIIHLVFIASGVLMAIMDKISTHTKTVKAK